MDHILCLVGFSGCGKDSIARVLEKEYGYKFVTSVTSRPKRSNETDGVEYHFKTEDDFKELIHNNQLIEYRNYSTIQNGKPAIWHYGITKDEIDLEKQNHIAVVDIRGLRDLKNYFGDKVISVFIDVDEEDRRMRAIARDRKFEWNEWVRRYKSDKKIFKQAIKEVDFTVENYDFKKCIDEILDGVKLVEDRREFFSHYA